MFDLINIWAVLGAAVAGYLFGGLWYNFLFKKQWMDATGKTTEKIIASKMSSGPVMFYGFLVTAVVAFALAVFMVIANVGTLYEALQIGMLLCFGFVVTTHYTRMIYESDEAHWSIRPQKLFLISAGYQIGLFTIMSSILWWFR